MAWQADSFANMPKFASAISIPLTAQYSGPIYNLTDLRTAIDNPAIEVFEWQAGSFIDSRFEIDVSDSIGGNRFLTGNGVVPPLYLKGAERWVIKDMTFSSQAPTDAKRQYIEATDTKEVTITDCSRTRS